MGVRVYGDGGLLGAGGDSGFGLLLCLLRSAAHGESSTTEGDGERAKSDVLVFDGLAWMGGTARASLVQPFPEDSENNGQGQKYLPAIVYDILRSRYCGFRALSREEVMQELLSTLELATTIECRVSGEVGSHSRCAWAGLSQLEARSRGLVHRSPTLHAHKSVFPSRSLALMYLHDALVEVLFAVERQSSPPQFAQKTIFFLSRSIARPARVPTTPFVEISFYEIRFPLRGCSQLPEASQVVALEHLFPPD